MGEGGFGPFCPTPPPRDTHTHHDSIKDALNLMIIGSY